MNTLKLRAFVRLYIPSIDKAQIKHGYSTDIALFTQTLRRKIEQGEMYYQCALPMLKKYLSSIVLVLLQYCLGTDLVFISYTIFGLASDFCLTNFAPTSAFHAIGSGFSSGFHRATPIKTRCGLDENPMKCRNSAGIGRVMLSCLAIVSMFSLSAQTPRKDSGADGLSHLVALKPGDKIPDAVWNQSLELNYFNGQKKTIKFSDLKGKLILLDFWATWCSSCLEGFPHMEEVKELKSTDIAILLVNSVQTKDTQKRIDDLKKKYSDKYGFQTSLPYLFGDTLFQKLFPHNAIPHVVWINKAGLLIANTYPNALTPENVNAVLHDGNTDLHQKEWRTKDEVSMFTDETLDNGFYAGSIFKAYQEGLASSDGKYSFDGTRTKYQFLNLSFAKLLSLAFGNELKGIPWRHWQFVPVKDKNRKLELLAPDRFENRFCYEMVVKDSLSKEKARQNFIADFKQFFGIELSISKRPIDVWHIVLSSDSKKIISNGGIPQVFLGDSRTDKKFLNIPLGLLVDNLSLYFDRPLVIREADHSIRVDMIIPKDFEGWKQERKLEFLQKMGLQLNLDHQPITCAVFSLLDK